MFLSLFLDYREKYFRFTLYTGMKDTFLGCTVVHKGHAANKKVAANSIKKIEAETGTT